MPASTVASTLLSLTRATSALSLPVSSVTTYLPGFRPETVAVLLAPLVMVMLTG